ncbi:MAG: glucokinase [Deltaproteobacteria bacterium]|nr:glucokinase [Deltaproteobacteria bacterium]
MANPTRKEEPVLAADIGGTKTVVGAFERGRTRPRSILVKTYSSGSFRSFEQIIMDFLSHTPIIPKAVCIGIAGPVLGGKSKATNLPWTVSQNRLSRRFEWKAVSLYNDLVTTAMAIPLLRRSEVVTINAGRVRPKGNVALVAPGTGLGQATLIYYNGHYVPMPSEGGHCDFAPTSNDQAELWQYLHEKYGHVSLERLLSGPGMINIYSWLKDAGKYNEPKWLSEKLSTDDRAKAITEAALSRGTPICKATLRLFASILGSVCGNLALTTMASGGVYLGGGIPPKILPFLQDPTFFEAFTEKGRFKQLLSSIPVKVITNQNASLLGAAHMAFIGL